MNNYSPIYDIEKHFMSIEIFLIEEKTEKNLNVYAWILEESYYKQGEELLVSTGSSIPYKFEISNEEVVIALDCSKMPLSIYDRCDEDEEGQELIQKIPYEDNEEKNIDKIHLSTIIDSLSEREKRIVFLRFFRDKTQTEVAGIFGVSQVQISRIESKIFEKIRLKY